MGKLVELLKKYEANSSQVGWFKLEDDGDTALVRFLHTDDDDLEVYEVHKIEIDGNIRAVKCLGENCPACKEGLRPQLRMWLYLLNLEEGEKLQVWERGISDIKTVIGLIAENGHLNQRDYKIKRVGKKGSNKTTYQYFYKDKSIREDLPDRPKTLGRYVLELTAEDIKKAIKGQLTLKSSDDFKLVANDDLDEVF